MKKIIVFILMFYSSSTFSQNGIRIYEVGQNLINCETNFQNLFNNWNTKNFDSATDIRLINYAFVETLSKNEDIENYCRVIISRRSMVSTVKKYKSNQNNNLIKRGISVSLSSLIDIINSDEYTSDKTLELLDIEINNTRRHLKNRVKVGDKVYAIFYSYKSRIYVNYVICDSKSNSVIWDNIFMNIKMAQ